MAESNQNEDDELQKVKKRIFQRKIIAIIGGITFLVSMVAFLFSDHMEYCKWLQNRKSSKLFSVSGFQLADTEDAGRII